MYKISWETVTQLVKELAKKVPGWRVWGIPRGGTIVEALLAYQGCKQTAGHDATTDVVVDDIADTGVTLREYAGPTATLVVRLSCKPLPTYWVMALATSEYILFPWEDEAEAQKKIDAGKSFRDVDNE